MKNWNRYGFVLMIVRSQIKIILKRLLLAYENKFHRPFYLKYKKLVIFWKNIIPYDMENIKKYLKEEINKIFMRQSFIIPSSSFKRI